MHALPHAPALSSAFIALWCRCVIVGSLQVEYRLPTGSGVTISQPQPRAAALQGSDLYVEVDKLDSYTHILPELTRLFAKGAVQPELAQFLIALTLTMVSLCPAFLLLVICQVNSPHCCQPLSLSVSLLFWCTGDWHSKQPYGPTSFCFAFLLLNWLKLSVVTVILTSNQQLNQCGNAEDSGRK